MYVINEEYSDRSLTKPYYEQLQKRVQSLNQMKKLKGALIASLKSLNQSSQTFKASGWLYKLKIKHQILFLTLILVMVITAMQIGFNNIQMTIFTSILSDGFDQMLVQQNANFQAQIMIKYMSLTREYFYNEQQILIAINSIYNHGLKSNYQIDSGIECSVFNDENIYPSYSGIDQLCYNPQGSDDKQTFENSTQNTEFIKFTSILNQFILCFDFQLQFSMTNLIQINLENQDQMGSYYPQSIADEGYLPTQRYFFRFQKQQFENNITKEFYISQYQKFYSPYGPPSYGQTLTFSLLSGRYFQGVIAISMQFSVFQQLFKSYADMNLALVALDGTILFEQNQFQTYAHQQFIYNQSLIGYNYLDWLTLSSHQDYTKQVIMNNTLFSEPIKVNVKKFHDLPYYFIVYNNLTYETQIKTIQLNILAQINSEYRMVFYQFIILFMLVLIVSYYSIEYILKPLVMIKQIIGCSNQQLKCFQQQQYEIKTKNILYILQLIIYLKYSELQNLSLSKNHQCQNLENLQYPIREFKNKEIYLLKYLLFKQQLISNQYQDNIIQDEAYNESADKSGCTFTFQ